MKYGLSTDYINAKILKDAGFDFIELNLSKIAAMSDEEIASCVKTLADIGIPAESANIFFPAEIKITGPEADDEIIKEYVSRAMYRASQVGIKVVVLGSSRSRNLPEGYDPELGYEQFIKALRISGDIAMKYDIMIAIEPLHFPESNIINRVSEGLKAARDANHPNVKTLADIWHMYCESESYEVIANSSGEIIHIHVASPVTRRYPSLDDGYDYTALRAALHACNYNARLTIEARSEDITADAPRALELLKTL